jgi:cobalt-zinc-cadmium efflux system outer membrane protein
LALLVASPGGARADPPRALDAESFLRRVDARHPQAEASAAAVAAAEAEVTAAGTWANPVLSFGRDEVFSGDRRYPEHLLRLEMPFEISGRRGLRLAAARLGVRAERQRAARSRSEVLARAMRAYLLAAAARQRLAILADAQRVLAPLLGKLRTRALHGDAAGLDRERLALELDDLEDQVEEARRGLASRQRLLALLAGDPGGAIDATDPLILPGAPDVDAAVIGRETAARADREAARLDTEQARTEVAAARRGWVPGLTVWLGLRTDVPDRATAWGYSAGLSLTLPLLDRGQGDRRRAEARLRLSLARERRVGLESTARAHAARDALVRSRQQVERLRRSQVPRAERLIRIIGAGYHEGDRTLFEVLEVHRLARGVQLRHLALLLRANLDAVELRQALGRPLRENPR